MGRRKDKSPEVTPLYTRGETDESLWDDSDLIRMWNEQLDNDQQEETEHNGPMPADVSRDGSLIVTESESDGGGSAPSSSAPQAPQRSSTWTGPAVGGNNSAAAGFSGTLLLDMNRNLPPEIQRLAMAYYNAGYEAGHFVASYTSAVGKRPRS
uniref:Uncharacterized protein TCIL3000_11_15200 n=1 Tax=Trypanosoma congolense (strain IL3000) TaxID=1068625 RepID=G0V2Y0_TRYCI|nr:unnamed protein product [Trypanosoma congolense IL3000]